MSPGKRNTDGRTRPPRRSGTEFLPRHRSLRSLRLARDCQGCELYRNATQTVFGEGPAEAVLMIVGEVPGDQEDLQGAIPLWDPRESSWTKACRRRAWRATRCT